MNKTIQQLEAELASAKARITELEVNTTLSSDDLLFHSQILLNMSEGVCLVSANDASITFANPVLEKMFGYESGELIGRPVTSINAPEDDAEKTAAMIMSALQKTGQWQGEVKNIKKDGSTFWCYARVVAYLSPQFGPVYISVHQDITDKKLIENALYDLKEFDNRLFDTAQIIILVLDTEGRIVSFNPYMEKLTGYQQDEVIGKDWFTTFLPGSDQQAIKELFRSSVNDINTSGNINPILAKDGHEVCIEWYDSTLKDQNGKTLGVLAVGHDISEQRKTQQELQQTYRTLDEIQHAMDLVGIGIHMVEPVDGRFIYVNNAACEMLGYSRQEMLTMTVPDIDPNFPPGSFQDQTRDLRDSPGQLETTQITKDGRTIPVEVAYHYFSGINDEPGHFVSFLVDLTERKGLEAEHDSLQKQLLQSQKMESIGHLAGGVAHDFNNMLAAILGYSGLIDKHLLVNSLADEKSTEYLEQITTAANRARELISQMLIFSRKASDDAIKDIPVVAVKPILTEVISLLSASIPSSIEIKTDITCADSRTRINPVQLHQIILNLCINSRDAINEYGEIMISLGRKTLTDTVCMSCHKNFTGDYVEFMVSDSGQGMNNQQLQRIFEPFFTTKEVGQGSGMGLSVVHGIVHAADGHILISSEESKGTSVCVLLPLVSDDVINDDSEKAEDDTDNQLQGLRIMIVDDEKQIASMMAEIFEMHGAETYQYNRSTQALAVFELDPLMVDLVLTDETMPELTGLDMSRSMLGIRPELPIIISTGYSEHVNQKIAREHGIAGFIMKPVNIHKLISLIVDLTVNTNKTGSDS